MKSSRIFMVVGGTLCTIALSAFAATAATKPAPATKPVAPAVKVAVAPAANHGMTARGSVVSYDAKLHSLVMKDAAGKNLSFTTSEATRITGAPLAAGQEVTVAYMAKDGKNMATAVVRVAAKTAAAAPHAKK